MSLDKFTDEELNKELQRRRDEKRKVLRESAIADYNKLTSESVNAFVPQHGRTSCSDNNVCNGFGSGDYSPRCARCALLEILKYGPEYGADWKMDVQISFTKI